MAYIKISTGTYPLSERDIRSAFPNTSFPVPFKAPEDYAWVFPTPQPSFDAITQSVAEGAPTQQGGNWVQTWVVTNLDQPTIDANIQAAIDQARVSAHRRIDDAYTAQTNQLATGYPENEQKSWPVQIMEADAILAGAETPTPWVDAASAGRGVTRLEMAQLIKTQDTLYRTYHGQLSGVRQALRDQIDAIPDGERTSIAALGAIDWPKPPEEETEM